MKTLGAVLLLWAACVDASDVAIELNAEQIRAKVVEVTEAHNKMMLKGSTVADVDALFALYSADFVYVHTVYGDTYSRDELRGNSLRNVTAGRYKLTKDRYQIVQIIAGLNVAAVERLELDSGKKHLAVFEFRGAEVSKVTEYWK